MLLEVYRDRTDYLGREAQDGHLNFHTALNWALSGETNITGNIIEYIGPRVLGG